MQKTHVTNNHLRNQIKNIGNFVKHGSNPPEDLLFEFIYELKVSNLILPARDEDGGIVFEQLISDTGLNLIPVFTDDMEFSKLDTDFSPQARPLDFYATLLSNHDLSGLIVNIASDEFFISKELIFKIQEGCDSDCDDNRKALSPEELRDLAENTRNEGFIKAMDDEKLEEFGKSALLNVVNIDNGSSDEIIKSDSGFKLMIKSQGREKFALLFTDRDAIDKALDKSTGNYYCQIADLDKFFGYVLKNDLDGIIINPGLENKVILRKTLFEVVNNVNLANPKLKNASDYAFKL